MELLKPHTSVAVVDRFVTDAEEAWKWQGYYPGLSIDETVETTEAARNQSYNVDTDVGWHDCDHDRISAELAWDELIEYMDVADIRAKAFHATIVSAATTIQRAFRARRVRR